MPVLAAACVVAAVALVAGVVGLDGLGSLAPGRSVDGPLTLQAGVGAVGEAPSPVGAVPVVAPSALWQAGGAQSPRGQTSRPTERARPTPQPTGAPTPGPSIATPGPVASARETATTRDPAPAPSAPPVVSGPVPTVESTPRRPDDVTVAFTGDILTHGPVNDRARDHAGGDGHDYGPLFAAVRPLLVRADLALCHLEVPLAPAGEAITSYPTFGAPASLVDGIAAAGYDGCSVASNHSLDRGMAGVRRTLDRFEQVGLGHAGTARSASEGRATTVYAVDGVRVAHLSYAYGFNGLSVPDDAPWAANQIDVGRIVRDARRARLVGDVVVVSLHWGSEYVHEPSGAQRAVADALLPSDDIDLVVGHHAHVVQPIEQVDGTWVVWGLGNHLSNQQADDERDGLLAVVRFAPDRVGRWRVVGIRAVPTWVDLDTHRVVPAMAGRVPPGASGALRQELAAGHRRVASLLRPDDVEELSIVDPPCAASCHD